MAAAPANQDAYVVGRTEDVRKFYSFGQRIGQPGQFGYAVTATHLQTGEARAIKVISKARFERSPDRAYHFGQLRGEIEVMRTMRHPNIIQFYEVFEDDTALYIVMELCTGGELFDRIQAQGSYSEQDAAAALRQMCEGIHYMHSRKIAHCDLKPDNFLFLRPEAGSPIKVIDFGMSKFVKRRKYFKMLCGTPYYVAPEVTLGAYSEHADMWSMGVVMFVMVFGYPPFYVDAALPDADARIFRLIQGGFDPRVLPGYGPHFPSAIPSSESARDLLSRLLTRDVARRLSAAEALEHPWLRGQTASATPIDPGVITSLRRFEAANHFKQAVLHMMTGSLSEAELRRLRSTFEALDEDNDGSVTVDEMRRAVERGDIGIDHHEVENLIRQADIDGDGKLSYHELLLTAVNRKLAEKEERLWDTFRRLDVDGDGRVTAAEITQVLGQNDAMAQHLLRQADTNGDGVIDYDEFVDMWSEHQAAGALGNPAVAAAASPLPPPPASPAQ